VRVISDNVGIFDFHGSGAARTRDVCGTPEGRLKSMAAVAGARLEKFKGRSKRPKGTWAAPVKITGTQKK